MNRILNKIGILVVGLSMAGIVSAQSSWVSDEFEVTLRTGPSTSNAIELMVSSGTRLQILEQDDEAGYSRVRTQGGTEGWVLTRYLMDEPSAREQLQNLTTQLTDAAAEGDSLGSQLVAIRTEYDTATRRIEDLESENARLQDEMAEISSKAANTLAIDRQNQELQQKLTDAEIQVNVLEQEKDRLTGQSSRSWFVTGAAVLFVGVLVGLILPKMSFRRKSRYDTF